ncbi:MAG TPA: hypothetical protein VHG71_08455 [Verrucomicrobiae bacterium]|nr:hypothetical protein [Verrucomicrobiae bacterium]
MSDSHETKTAAPVQTHDEHPVDFNAYARRCGFIFVGILCAIGLMLWISYLPGHTWALKSALILVVAAFNAFVVAGFLMHLLSEKKMIYTVLGFTVFFVAGLFVLTIYAMHDFPTGTQMH